MAGQQGVVAAVSSSSPHRLLIGSCSPSAAAAAAAAGGASAQWQQLHCSYYPGQHQQQREMQPASLLGSRGPSSARATVSNAGLTMPPLLSPPQPPTTMQFEQAEHTAPAMDEFLEQMFSVPSSSWSERSPWDHHNYNATAAAAGRAMGIDAQKLFTMSLLPPGLLGARDSHDAADSAHVAESVLNFPSDDHLLAARLRGLQEPSAVPGIGTRAGVTLTRSPSVGSSGSEGSGGPHSPPPIAPTWRQPYVGGVPPLLVLGQAKPESLRGDSGEAHILGKRPPEEDEVSMRDTNVRDPSHSLYGSLVGAGQGAQNQVSRSAPLQTHSQGIGNPAHGLQQGVQNFGSPSALTSAAQTLGNSSVVVAARPRVRARRGQATDPHSIAERLRRERIAERMKALQELVPNSNKTDKASMLDEIIEYVKFLQLQVKVLSMSRLGGAGAVAPLVADLPSEGPSSFVNAAMGRGNGGPGPSADGLALTERQVARLMEEDMGSAMQYLQSKGLCLMPISLATAISSSNTRSQGGNGAQQQGSGDRQRSDSSAAGVAVSNTQSNSASAAIDLDGSNKGGNSGANNNPNAAAKDGAAGVENKSSGGVSSSSSKQSPNAASQKFKGKDESQRRSQ